MDVAIAIAAVIPGQRDDIGRQSMLVGIILWQMTLRRAVLAKRRVKVKVREDRGPAADTNDTWAMDFVPDQLATGRKIRTLAVIDTVSRFSPATDPRFSYCGEDVVRTLERICGQRVFPGLSGSTRARSLSVGIWSYGRIRRGAGSTFPA
ncbi:hypothetical protein JK182_13020 [Acetobacter okinawensis]|nr:hypothetical protein [Acetobacter okinawensis]